MIDISRSRSGWIEVIAGSMFSGKSEELIRRLKRAKIAKQRVKIFKPKLDDRDSTSHIVSRNATKLEAIMVATSKDILELVGCKTEVVGIDEIQFFDEDLPGVAEELANLGKRVITAGLSQDYLGKPFENTASLLARAEYITKALAICIRCGDPANYNQRIGESKERIVVGSDAYEARCRRCFDPGQ